MFNVSKEVDFQVWSIRVQQTMIEKELITAISKISIEASTNRRACKIIVMELGDNALSSAIECKSCKEILR